MTEKKATTQANGVSSRSGTKPPKKNQFGQPNGNKRNNGGLPKYVRDIRAELKNLLNPNLTINDYRKIVKDAETDSGLRAVFASAIVSKDHKVILSMMNQAYGQPMQVVSLDDKRDGPTDEEIDRRIAEALNEPQIDETTTSTDT